jgi:hypothetical protein
VVVKKKFNSPYEVSQWSGLENFFCGFSTHYDTQSEMAKVITGQSSAQGQWPVTIAGVGETAAVGDWSIY